MVLRRLKYVRVVGRPHQHHAGGDGGAIRDVDKVSPRTIKKLNVCKDQVRMGLLEEENGLRLGPDAEGIDTQALEHEFERLAGLRAVMNYESERFTFHGIPPRHRGQKSLTDSLLR